MSIDNNDNNIENVNENKIDNLDGIKQENVHRFPRGLKVLITMAVLAILIWVLPASGLLTDQTPYYYYSIGAAIIITALAIYLIYRKPSASKMSGKKANKKNILESEEEMARAELEADDIKPGDIAAGPENAIVMETKSSKVSDKVELGEESPIPLIEDQSTLTLDEKNLLVNAVWYRCENPYCKYTSFLSVHHIVEENDGGSNKLNNLIVLCPYCHDLAHRGEMPEKEMLEWISDRAQRWKFKPEWKYF